MPILGVSAKSGQGMSDWLDLIGLRLAQSREVDPKRREGAGDAIEASSSQF
jgi:hypothetical protein